MGLLGLAQRAGALVRGTAKVRRALRRGEVQLVIVAQDASPGQVDKVVRLAERRNTRVARVPSRAELGAAVGAPPLAVVGVVQDPFAQRIAARLEMDLADRR